MQCRSLNFIRLLYIFLSFLTTSYGNLYGSLSIVCKILSFIDLQMKPYRTDEFVHKLFYETSRFGAFNNQWVVKARINSNQRDPTQSSERDMTYQVRKTA